MWHIVRAESILLGPYPLLNVKRNLTPKQRGHLSKLYMIMLYRSIFDKIIKKP